MSTKTYTADEMCGAPATTVGYRPPGYLHSATITGLTPNTQYFYQVGDSTPHSESEVHHFWSAPKPNADNVEFVIFGDLGQVETDGSFEASQMEGSILTTTALPLTLSRVLSSSTHRLPSSILATYRTLADTSACGNSSSSQSRIMKNTGTHQRIGCVTSRLLTMLFDGVSAAVCSSQISRLSPYLPWQTIDGNHERDWPNSGSATGGTDSGGECGIAIARRFPHAQHTVGPAAHVYVVEPRLRPRALHCH